jgi:hypothetical protein
MRLSLRVKTNEWPFILTTLYALGYAGKKSIGGSKETLEEAKKSFLGHRFLFIEKGKHLNAGLYENGHKRLETFGELINEIQKQEALVVITVKLNDEYSAEVSKTGVKVGCQTFPLEVIDELAKVKKSLTES